MNKLLAALHSKALEWRSHIVAQIERDMAGSDRLKMLLAAAVGILLLSGLFGMHQLVSSLADRYTRAKTDLTRLQAQIKTNAWQGRRHESQVLKSSLEDRLWAAQTPGLADASFERWLRDHLSRYNMDPQQPIQIRRVSATGQAKPAAGDPLADIQRMTAKIVMPFDATGLASFLADIAEADKTVVVDRLSVRAGRNPRIELDVSAFYRSRENKS